MQSGEQRLSSKAYISEESVWEALEAISEGATRLSDANPLRALVMVDEFLANPDLPPLQYARDYAIQHIVTDTVTNSLFHQYTLLGLMHAGEPVTREEMKRLAQEAAALDVTSLMRWVLLYCCYIRGDVAISLAEFGDLVGLVPRSIRRYREKAITMLTRKLSSMEWKARTHQRKRRLFATLGIRKPLKLYGRDESINSLRGTLNKHEAVKLFVSGPPGIGKTVLVQEALRSSIANDTDLDLLLWVDCPVSTQQVLDALTSVIKVENAPIDWREFLVIYRTVIVIDGIDEIDDTSTFDRLLKSLNLASVIVISRTALVLAEIDQYITLEDISRDSTYAFIHSLRQDCDTDFCDAVYQSVGGIHWGLS